MTENTRQDIIKTLMLLSLYRQNTPTSIGGELNATNGKTLNADVNGALNILRKSSVVDLTVLYSRGEVDTPVRIRIA